MDSKFKKSLQRIKPKLRAGSKMMVNTKTWKTWPVFTIEIYVQKRLGYLPMKLPDGSWYLRSAKRRDAMLKKFQKLTANHQND